MAQFKAFAPDLADPKPGQWYPQQRGLDAFKTVSETVGYRTRWAEPLWHLRTV